MLNPQISCKFSKSSNRKNLIEFLDCRKSQSFGGYRQKEISTEEFPKNIRFKKDLMKEKK